MTKPPVKLGVGKKFLEKSKEPPSDRMKLVWQPQHFNIGGSMSMNDVKSLSLIHIVDASLVHVDSVLTYVNKQPVYVAHAF